MRINHKTDNKNKKKKQILLVGNPNVGKTTIFNHLSKKYAVTANYPFTTIELNQDIIKIDQEEYELIDTAGIYRLDHPSEEGQITRDLLFNQRDKFIIQIVESAKLEQSLLLTFQLLDLNIPMVLVLNMNDELPKQGVRINSKILSEQLGIPVIETIATEEKGVFKIINHLKNLISAPEAKQYPPILKSFIREIDRYFPDDQMPPRSIINLLVLDDPFAIHWIKQNYNHRLHQQIIKAKEEYNDNHVANLSVSVINYQNVWIKKVINNVITRREEITKFGIQKFGEWSRHHIFGWLIMLAVILLTYLIVGKFGASFLVIQVEHLLIEPIVNFVDQLVTVPFINRLLVGDYGILTVGLFNAIGTVLPIITLFFLVLNFLEDFGYLTNLIILTSRVFNKFGLTGKSILPIVLGFGCKTMATLSTKILDSKREKYIAIFLIGLAIPCSSQLSINIAVLSKEAITSFFIVIAILTLIEISAGLILNRIIPQEKQSDFIIEIPPLRIPDLKMLLQKTYYRTLWFLKEAVPLFILGASVLFVLNETSGMDILERLLRPIVVDFLNLPIRFSEAMVMSLARSEAGAVLIMNMVNQGELNPIQVIVSVTVITLFIPCISNVMAMIKEIKLKQSLIMLFVITFSSIMIGGLINFILRLFSYGG